MTAPAGYGKTTAVNSWLDTINNPIAWVSLDSDDNDVRQCLSYALSAIQSCLGEDHVDVFNDIFNMVKAVTLPPLSKLTANLINIGYGQEGFWNVNALVSALPWFGSVQGLSLYGGMALTINPKYKTAQSGFIFAGTENVSTSWSSLSDSFDDGVFLAGFHRFFWDMDDKMGYFADQVRSEILH